MSQKSKELGNKEEPVDNHITLFPTEFSKEMAELNKPEEPSEELKSAVE